MHKSWAYGAHVLTSKLVPQSGIMQLCSQAKSGDNTKLFLQPPFSAIEVPTDSRLALRCCKTSPMCVMRSELHEERSCCTKQCTAKMYSPKLYCCLKCNANWYADCVLWAFWEILLTPVCDHHRFDCLQPSIGFSACQWLIALQQHPISTCFLPLL